MTYLEAFRSGDRGVLWVILLGGCFL